MNGSVTALNRYDFNIETKFEILALKDEHEFGILCLLDRASS